MRNRSRVTLSWLLLCVSKEVTNLPGSQAKTKSIEAIKIKFLYLYPSLDLIWSTSQHKLGLSSNNQSSLARSDPTDEVGKKTGQSRLLHRIGG